ncbi:MAG: ABC transporter permease [Gemmatimonadetes bacterium]|nr:ABC transporter permease [Gemmatimonadota bacterium]
MDALRRIALYFRDLFGRGKLDEDLEREFAFHLEMEVAEHVRRGMSRERAEKTARRAFGNAHRHRQASRDARTWSGLERAFTDVRHAFRAVRRHPGFAAAAVSTLALGLAATTAIFSVVDGVLLRPLPYPDGDRIVRVGWSFGTGGTVDAVSPLKFRHVADDLTTIEALATRRSVSFELGSGPDAPLVDGQRVSPSFFTAMGVAPEIGRPFTPAEAESGARVVILSERVWRQRFGGDPSLVDRAIELDGEPHAVIGVMPRGFELVDLPGADDVLVPFRFAPGADEERGNNYAAIGRLAPDASRETAETELRRLSSTFRRAYPDQADEGEGYTLTGYLSPYVDERVRTALWGFLAAAGFVLFIACVNVISLFLARGQVREREFSLRAVLGAPASRLGRQVLTESLVLTAIAAVLGSALAAASLRVFLALVPTELPRAATIGIDPRVMVFCTAAAGLTAFVAGLPAAVPAARARLLDALAGGRSGALGRRRTPIVRRALVTGQVATSFVLLSGAGVLGASLWNLVGVDLGFSPEGLYSVELARTREPPPGPLEPRLEGELVPAIAALPGVRSVALSGSAPLERGLNFPLTVTGADDERSLTVELRPVSPDYFAAVPIPITWGRGFGATDHEGAEPVAIINRSLARIAGAEGRGATLQLGRFRDEVLCPACPPRRVVGVVEDLREISPDAEARPTAYVPISQAAGRFGRYGLPRILVRTDGPPPSVDAVRRAAARLGFVRDVRVRPATELWAATLAVDRFNAWLMGAFAIVAVAITGVGLYGFLAYMVNLRRREAGIRLAVGASRGSVARALTSSGLGSVSMGIVAGIALTIVLSRFLTSQLFGISAVDVRVLAGVTAVLFVVGALASLVPARRAIRIDPAGLLHED